MAFSSETELEFLNLQTLLDRVEKREAFFSTWVASEYPQIEENRFHIPGSGSSIEQGYYRHGYAAALRDVIVCLRSLRERGLGELPSGVSRDELPRDPSVSLEVETLEKERWVLENSFGNGAFQDGQVVRRIDEIDDRLSVLRGDRQCQAPAP